jgi:hypothetical protein
MKVSVVSLLLLATSVSGFISPQLDKVTTLRMSSAVEAEPFTKSERIIMDELPTVFVYDHCPFCVRVRLALGIKNVKHNVRFMANDDIPTPTKLVGKKIAPIFVSEDVNRHLEPLSSSIFVFLPVRYIIFRPSLRIIL